jgi:hypothetical protein
MRPPPRGLTDQIVRDERGTLELGDAGDMMHAVVPCAYCDFVWPLAAGARSRPDAAACGRLLSRN